MRQRWAARMDQRSQGETTMAAQQQVVRVKVPQGATVGSTVQATLPNGQQVKVQLPPGVVPGPVSYTHLTLPTILLV